MVCEHHQSKLRRRASLINFRPKKASYLCQVALIAIFAHVGCYMMPRYSSFRIIDSLFTWIGTGDDLKFNPSIVRPTIVKEIRCEVYYSRDERASFYLAKPQFKVCKQI